MTAPPLNVLYFVNTTTTVPTVTVPATTSSAPGAFRANAQPPTIIPRTTLTGLVTATAPPESATQQASPQVTTVTGTGSLSVITNPAGAQVFIDDVLRGASPATVPNLAVGSHTLRLEREGYRNMTVPVAINDGKTTDYSTALVPESSGGMGMLPLIIGAVIVIALVGACAYLSLKKKKPA